MSHFWRVFGYVVCSIFLVATLILAPFTLGISLIGTVVFAVIIWAIKKSGQVESMQTDLKYIADRERRLDKELAETERKLKEKQQKLEGTERIEEKQKRLEDLKKKTETDNEEDNEA
jgi:hypothetical protein